MKKSLQKSLALIMAVLMMFGATPILGAGMLAMAADGLTSIPVLPGSLCLKISDTDGQQLRVGGRGAGGAEYTLDPAEVQWSSTNSEIVSVDSNGLVKPGKKAAAGDAVTIYAFYSVGSQNYVSKCDITVISNEDAEKIGIKSIAIIPESVTLKEKQQYAFSAIGYENADRTGQAVSLSNVTWASKNSVYATVSNKGIVTAVKSTEAKLNDKVINNGVEITATYLSEIGSKETVLTASAKVYIDASAAELTSISIVPAAVTDLEEGGNRQLQAVGHGSDGKDYPLVASQISWTSSNTDYVTVDASGKITGVKPTGERNDIFVHAYYTVDSKTYAASCNVKVLKVEPEVSYLAVGPAETVIGVGDSVQMIASGLSTDNEGNTIVVPLDNSRLRFQSADSTVLQVSDSGRVTALKTTGSEGVTVYGYYTNKKSGKTVSGTAKVIVRQRVDEIRWNWEANTLIAGETYYYGDKYQVFPTSAQNKGVELTSSDPTVIEVNEAAQTFTVNKYPGNEKYIYVTLTLKAKDPSSKCKDVDKQFLVFNEVPLTGIHWDLNVNSKNETQFRFYENDAKKKEGVAARYWYEATKFNGLGKNKYHTDPSYAAALCDITVTSSDERIMKVDKATKSLIPVGNGRCILTITARTKNGSVVVSDTVTAIVIDSDYTPPTDVQIGINEKKSSKSNYSVLSASSIRLAYTKSMVLGPMVPSGKSGTFDHDTFELTLEDGRVITVYEAAKIVWKSDNPSAVTVDKDGKVTAVGPGSAKITVTVTDNGAKPIEASITVETKISLLQAIIGFLMSLIKLNLPMAGKYLAAVATGLFGSVGKFFGRNPSI